MTSIHKIVATMSPWAVKVLADKGGVVEVELDDASNPVGGIWPLSLDEFLDAHDLSIECREARPYHGYLGIVHPDGALLVQIAAKKWGGTK